ncbi:hypothetical protein [Natronosalvus rutilus]|uniref:DUF7847 domain-containing protein n=1 Tax=Natronosalvus rutilus TaxID=2953753 RepID=A0A9E7ST20_9EURY|nr:hypothetical protein [Natronosalvus rutilus]UTF52090.1 hypothetical protein NGM29_09740 [Natronosalvus rutilus]
MAQLSVLTAIDEAFERISDRRAVTVLGGLVVIQALMLVGLQSQLEAQRALIEEEELFVPGFETLPDEFPLAVDLSVGVATALWLAMLVAFVALSMVAFRVLSDQAAHTRRRADAVRDEVEAEMEPASAEQPAWNDELGRTTLSAVVVAFGGSLVVGLGLALFVVPGLVAATVLAFTHPYLAIERIGPIDAARRSVELTRGSWLRVFALLVVIVMSFLTVSSLGTVALAALESAPVAGELANVAFGSLAWLFALALLASGFDQLEARRAEEDEKWAGIDDELLP